MGSRQRRRFTGAEKVGIVKRHLVDKVPVSDLCDEAGLTPAQFYQWQKQLFENGASAFERTAKGRAVPESIAALEASLARRNAALAQVLDWLLVGDGDAAVNRFLNSRRG